MATWQPSLPGGIPRETPLDERPDAGTGDVPWESAPATSHVSRFRYWDVRQHPFLRRFGRGGMSQLHVVFKGPKGRGEGPEYWYFFAAPEAGAEIARKMAASPHPYGEVLHPLVIRAGVAYQRQSA